jgi:hypothetical protein
VMLPSLPQPGTQLHRLHAEHKARQRRLSGRPTPATLDGWPPYMPPAPYDHCIPRETPSRDIRVPTGQLAAIIAEVAHKHRISVIEIKSRRHEHRIVLARHEAFWRCRNETFFSLPQIGRAFGGFDHTTVLNGCRRHEKRMAEEAQR